MRYKFEDIAINSIAKRKPTDEDRKTYVGLEHLDANDLRITRFGSKVPIKGEKLLMTKGDILFGRRNTYLKRVAIAPHDGLFSAHGMILRPKEKVIDKDFFPFFISSDYFLNAAIRISVGSISPTVNWGMLKTLEFELPPLNEQRQLSNMLWAFIDTRNAYKTLLLLTEQLVKSRFVEMFGDPVMNDKGWPVKPIKTFATVRIGPFGSLLHAEDYVENGIPLVNPSHIVNSRIMIDPKMTLSTNKYETLSSYILQTGDVILGRRGEIGRCAVVDNGEYMCGTGSMFIRIKGDYLPMMLQKIISSDAVRRVLENRAVGVTMQNLNAEIITELVVIMPPLSLQNRFAEFARQADKSKFAALRQTKSAKLLYTIINGG